MLNLDVDKPKPIFSIDAKLALVEAEGWLELGVPRNSLKALSRIEFPENETCLILRARVRVLLHLRRWRQANSLSRIAMERFPDDPHIVAQKAFTLEQLGRAKKAIKVIMSTPEPIRVSGILHYNIACYESLLGDRVIAEKLIERAISMNAKMRKLARSDDDLKSVVGKMTHTRFV